jgi:cytochrome c oxidase cbb3-type subunit 3
MPKFEGALAPAQVDALADYVVSLAEGGKAGEGAKLFAENCVACHGEKGEGSREVGAPRLSDKIWLYGGDKAAITETILKSRNGNMPAWSERLDETTIKMLTIYVHELGGGE